MIRRRFLQLLGCVPCLGLAACTAAPPLRVGIHPWIGYQTLNLAHEFGWLPDTVSLSAGSSARDSQQGLRSGTLDAAALTLDEVLRLRAGGLKLTVLMIFNVSSGADMVVAKPDIGAVSGLEGKRLAVERSAVGELMLANVLASGRLPETAVQVIDLPVDQHLEAWRKGEIDAAITYEPFASALVQHGAARLIDSRAFPPLIYDVLVVRSERLEPLRAQLRGLLQAHFRALQHITLHLDDTLFRIGRYLGVDHDTARRMLSGVVLPTLNNNLYQMRHQLPEVVAHLNRLLVLKAFIKQADNMDALFDLSLLQSLELER